MLYSDDEDEGDGGDGDGYGLGQVGERSYFGAGGLGGAGGGGSGGGGLRGADGKAVAVVLRGGSSQSHVNAD